jgi:hypothetical protein
MLVSDPTTPDSWEALREAQQALIRAADHIRSREGHSAAYRAAASAADRARDVLLLRLLLDPSLGEPWERQADG